MNMMMNKKILKEALRIGYKLQNEIEIPIWKEFLITNGYNPNLIKK